MPMVRLGLPRDQEPSGDGREPQGEALGPRLGGKAGKYLLVLNGSSWGIPGKAPQLVNAGHKGEGGSRQLAWETGAFASVALLPRPAGEPWPPPLPGQSFSSSTQVQATGPPLGLQGPCEAMQRQAAPSEVDATETHARVTRWVLRAAKQQRAKAPGPSQQPPWPCWHPPATGTRGISTCCLVITMQRRPGQEQCSIVPRSGRAYRRQP